MHSKVEGRWKIGVVSWLNQYYGTQVISGVLKYPSRRRFEEVPLLDASLVRPENPQLVAGLDGLIAVLDENETWRINPFPMPKVLVPRYSSEHPIHTVSTDCQQLGALAAEHLLGLGLKHVGILTLHAGLERGFHERARRDGANIIPHPPAHATTTEHRDQTSAWIRRLPYQSGIATHYHAADLIKMIMASGRRVPEDITVMGLIDDPMVSMRSKPTITSITLDTERIGWLAAEMLERLCRGETVTSLQVPPKGVICRQSTDLKHAMADDRVAKAIEYIHRHVGEMIDGAIIADHLGVSPMTLHWLFTETTGHSVHEEIRRHRLERAIQMLTDTEMTLQEIGYAIGIPMPPNFNRFIKQHTGLSPRQYRRKHQNKNETS
jgi:LacI family transcriptional regulator